tara:strand:- start:383 stop:574 length:192 start_codon:yes stop_codon:yes gene_type:complete
MKLKKVKLDRPPGRDYTSSRKKQPEHKRHILRKTILRSTDGGVVPGRGASDKSLRRAVKMFKR